MMQGLSHLNGASDVRKIWISSDFLSTSQSEQWSNLRWLNDILRRPVLEATGLEPETLHSSDDDDRAYPLSRRTFFERAGIQFDSKAKQFWFDHRVVAPGAINHLKECGFSSDLILIGYELSRATRIILTQLGVRYVDIWLHPIRFYDDILFGFQSNDAEIQRALGQFSVPMSQLYLYADRVKVQTYKGWHRVEAAVPPRSALFVGQTLEDKAVCRDGVMLNLLDFKNEFEALGAQYDKVYYSRHPFVKNGDGRILSYIRSCPFAELTEEPAYRLISHQNIECVSSISSSVVYEAQFFGKKAEFWFEPVLSFQSPSEDNYYATICQDFISPHFWSHVFSPAMDTRPVHPVEFFDKKDKIRDMLGFYWGYEKIDKVEFMRSRVRDASRAVETLKRTVDQGKAAPAPVARRSAAGGAWKPDLRGFIPNEEGVRRAQEALDEVAVASFDVFETLIERPLEAPEDIFLMMGESVTERYGDKIPDFYKARRAARHLAKKWAVGEEVPLSARYQALAEAHGLGSDDAEWLLKLELDWERRLCRPRLLGKTLYDRACQNGKKVILVSDTYFPKSFVAEVLQKNGFGRWDALYVSSEVGKLKASGALFEHVLEAEALQPDDVLHIGDNPISDIERAREKSMRAFHVRKSVELAQATSPSLTALGGIRSARTRKAVTGLVATRLASGKVGPSPSYSQGDPFTLGYVLLGPLFFGFANWLREAARERGVSDLFFLSRDGDIIKKCYDVLAADFSDAPRSHYVMSSRRSIRTANLQSATNILETLALPFSPCPLRDLLLNRFGISAEALDPSLPERYGLGSFDALADWAQQQNALIALFSDDALVDVVLENAADERSALIAYYQQKGMTAPDVVKPAIVDIGHEGSLQAGLQRLLDLPELGGFYFATFREIERAVPNAAELTAGYLINRFDRKAQKHSYLDFILMYEFVFLNDQGSFMRAIEENGVITEKLQAVDDESARIAFIRACHAGIVAFCEEARAHFGPLAGRFRLTGNEATASYRAMLEAPYPEDAQLFVGLSMENKYSGRSVRYVISPGIKNDPSHTSIWREGARLIRKRQGRNFYGVFGWRWLLTPFVAYFVGRIGGAREADLYRKDPAFYFAGLTSPRYRRIGKLLYPAAMGE